MTLHEQLLAINIASEIRYSNNKSREVINTKMKERSNYDDIHFAIMKNTKKYKKTPGKVPNRNKDERIDSYNDCLDMVQDFINPLRFENMRGNYVELRCNTLHLGDRVRRGPDWAYDDQDLGLAGTVVGQDFNDWIWVEWDHGNRLTYLYDEKMDTYQIRKVDEARILVNELIAVGCRVVRVCLPLKCLFRTSLVNYHNHHNLNTTNEDDPLDYVIPIYSDTTVSAIWEYKKGSQWTQYPSEINTKIEKAYQRKPTEKIVFEMNYTTCIIDFQRMIQETPQKKTEMPVRRKVLLYE
ncbi:hypothetical protein AM593_08157, partial [Mytilus galloprovincialis]